MCHLTRSLALVAASILATTGCSAADGHQGANQSSAAISDMEAQAAVYSHLRERNLNVDAVYFADDLGDYLPNQMVRIEGESPAPLSPGVVTGSVKAAELSAAYRIGGQDDPDGVRLDKTAPDADWRVVTVTFTVDEAWSDQVSKGDQVTIDISISGSQDVGTFLQGLESMDNAVVALDGTNQIGDASYSVAQNGTLLGSTGGGEITFPALPASESNEFVGDLTTTDEVDEAADEPQEAIVVDYGVVVDTGE